MMAEGGLILCIKPRAQLTRQEEVKVSWLKAAAPAFAIMRQLAMRFRGVFRGSDPSKLDAWLDDAHHTGLYGMRRLVRFLRRDIEAVRSAITETWSHGQTEGQINRLKTLKAEALDVWPRGNRIAPNPHGATDILIATDPFNGNIDLASSPRNRCLIRKSNTTVGRTGVQDDGGIDRLAPNRGFFVADLEAGAAGAGAAAQMPCSTRDS
jgi:hypothetical protein